MNAPTALMEPVPAYGAAIALHPLVRRIVAPNPGPMTYHGTSTWIVGRGRVAVIDPGPDDSAHRRAVLAALAGETVTHVLVTHGHHDHSAGAPALGAAVGAAVLGFGRPDAARTVTMGAGHPPFLPDMQLDDGAVVEGQGWRLSAIHTPGHASDHLCFALDGTGMLFSGDQVMGWSTSMVSPPDGDMAAYMRSLRLLLGRDDGVFLPGHGPAITDPQPHMRALLEHRLAREAGVLAALAAGATTPAAIVTQLYPGLAEPLQRAAGRSVLAHLLKLAAEGKAARVQPETSPGGAAGAGEDAFRAVN